MKHITDCNRIRTTDLHVITWKIYNLPSDTDLASQWFSTRLMTTL